MMKRVPWIGLACPSTSRLGRSGSKWCSMPNRSLMCDWKVSSCSLTNRRSVLIPRSAASMPMRSVTSRLSGVTVTHCTPWFDRLRMSSTLSLNELTPSPTSGSR